ncbi:MAG: hypothetical protein QOH16_2162 [Gaiellaceae bacterium]|nr:hypothetical protein [Gaiellaceae bacterium]
MSTLVAVEELYDSLDSRTLEILARRRSTPTVKRRGSLVRRALLCADLVGLSIAFLIAQELYASGMHVVGSLSQSSEFVAFVISLPGWVIAAKLYGLYDKDEERADHATADEFVGIFHLLTVCTFVLYAISLLTKWFNPQFSKLLIFWLIAIVATMVFRASARAYCRRNISYLQNTIIVGAGDMGQTLARKLLKHSEYGLNLVGFVDTRPKERGHDLGHLTILGGLEDLESLIELLDVERVIVAFTSDGHQDMLASIDRMRAKEVQIDIVPRLFDNLGPSVSIHSVEGIPLISLPPMRIPRSSLLIKRTVDVVSASIALALLLPVFIAIAVAIKLNSRGPVFYRHDRVGRRGSALRLLKFRTMYTAACRGDEYGGARAEEEFAKLMSDPLRRVEFETTFKLQDDPRVTRLGRMLRRSSLDELPQLWNVLRGDISLVGPRALTTDELDRYYGPAASTLLEVRPGITGYWQINGRSQLAYEDRVRLDLAYLDGWSLGLDFLILARTVRVLVSRDGAV